MAEDDDLWDTLESQRSVGVKSEYYYEDDEDEDYYSDESETLDSEDGDSYSKVAVRRRRQM